MKAIARQFILVLLCMIATGAWAQDITNIHGVVSDDMGGLAGASVCEIDGMGRIIEATVTDINGNFSMKVRNQKNKIRFSYIGYKTLTLPINKTVFKVTMKSELQIKEVTVTAKKRMRGNGLAIPER